jgi:hypothetical protein
MNQMPEIGQGVRVPWGVDMRPGEVVDSPRPSHAVVAVSVEGASGEQLDAVPATFSVDALEPLPLWKVENVRPGTPSRGADAARAWYIDASRNGDSARVEVRVSGSLAASQRSSDRFPSDTRKALQTRGRSAVEKFASRYRLPRVIVVGTNGVFELQE